jgi:hypothetical protein
LWSGQCCWNLDAYSGTWELLYIQKVKKKKKNHEGKSNKKDKWPGWGMTSFYVSVSLFYIFLFFFSKIGSLHVAQSGLQFRIPMILLSQPLEFWE